MLFFRKKNKENAAFDRVFLGKCVVENIKALEVISEELKATLKRDPESIRKEKESALLTIETVVDRLEEAKRLLGMAIPPRDSELGEMYQSAITEQNEKIHALTERSRVNHLVLTDLAVECNTLIDLIEKCIRP